LISAAQLLLVFCSLWRQPHGFSVFCSHVYVREQTIWSSTVSTATYGGTGCSSPICLLLLVWLQPSARLIPAAGVVACVLKGHRVTLLTRHRPVDDAILRRLQQRQLLCTNTSSCLFVSCGRRPSRTLPSSLGGDQRTSLACVKRPVGKIKNVTRTSRSPQTPAHVRSTPLRRASSISGCDKGSTTIDSVGRGSCRKLVAPGCSMY